MHIHRLQTALNVIIEFIEDNKLNQHVNNENE